MSRINEVTRLFTDTKEDIQSSISNWQDYLITASRLFKYSFDDQLLIYAQKPDATACANMEVWNKKMNRWIKQGSKGIALIRKNEGGKPRLEFVFDVADTKEVRGGKRPYLWEMQEEYHSAVTEQLSKMYGSIEKDDFVNSLMELTERAVDENYREFLHDLTYDLEDSFLEELDELNIDVSFKNTVTVSVQYMVLTRCGIDARQYLEDEDFRRITDFNTSAVLSHLGNAINLVSNEMLFAIGDVVRRREREIGVKSIENKRKIDYTKNIKFNTLKCESKDIKEELDNGKQTQLYSEWGLSDTRSSDGGFGQSSRYSGQVRNVEGDTPQGEPQGNIQPNVARWESLAAFGGGGQDGTRAGGNDDRRNDEVTGSNGGVENETSISLGAEGNQHQSTSRGIGDERTDLRKITDNQISLFPSIHEQIENIAQAKAEEQSSAFSFAQNSLFDGETISFEVVDKILATGGEERNTTSLIAGYMAFNTDLSANAEYLKKHYGRGGKGFDIDGTRYSLWFDETGICIAKGNQTYRARNKINLTWEQVAERVRNLLENGEYLSDYKLANAIEVYQKYVAEYFSFMYRDKAEDYTNEKLDGIVTSFVYPDCTEEIYTNLTDKEKLSDMLEGLDQMEQDFIADKKSTMRMVFHTPTEIKEMVKDFQNEPVIFPSKTDFKPIQPTFITEDELNSIYATDNRTSHFNTARIDTYAFFKQGHTDKEKADYLKNRYGWSGNGYLNTNVMYSAKGTEYTRGSLVNPYAKVIENWGQVVKRIDHLIAENRYLSNNELDYIPTYEKERIAKGIYHFYNYVPADIEKPFSVSDSDSSYLNNMDNAVKKVMQQLDDHEFVDNLLLQMEYVLDHTLSDERGYDTMEKAFKDLKDFQSGEYSIFNKQEYIIKQEEKGEGKPDQANTNDITYIAKKLERKRKTKHKETDDGQLSFDFANGSVSSILEDKGLMVSEESFVEEVGEKLSNENLEEQIEPQVAIHFDFDGGNLEDTPLAVPTKQTEKEIEDTSPKINFKIVNDDLGIGTSKEKYACNILAIQTLKKIETENRRANAEEQKILSQYVGWGGLADAFDESKDNWSQEYIELKSLLTQDEYEMARASTLNAHYTPPTVIHAMFNALENMDIPNGNILEPAMGTGNFFGMLPQSMQNSKLYGVELDSLTGRIAKQLYQNANIQIKGFEKTHFSNDFFDMAVGNVPFGNYKLVDKKYDKQNFLIHDYFFGKSLDKVRGGGIVAFITSKGTLDKENSEVRKYLAQRADLLGAIRLPNTAFKANAGTEVTSDIIFLQKRDHALEQLPSWIELGETENGVTVNKYFEENPQMIMGKMEMVSGPFGMESTCIPNTEIRLDEQLEQAIENIVSPDKKLLKEALNVADGEKEVATMEATPDVRNFSYTLVDDKLFFRENSRMKPVNLSDKAEKRVKALLGIRDQTRAIIEMQLNECSNEELQRAQVALNVLYDEFSKKFGLINSKASKQAFVDDVSYPLLCSLEHLDENGNLKAKADMFTKRTIKQSVKVTSVDTPSEALAVSISEKACVDIGFMASLMGGTEKTQVVINGLNGVIFKDPLSDADNQLVGWQTADEYLSGNVREKLAIAKLVVSENPKYQVNVDMLQKIQPKDLSAAEIDVRMGATWVEPECYKQFMFELLGTPRYAQNYKVDVMYSKHSGEWKVKGKMEDRANPRAIATYGTKRKNAYHIIEDSLNLRDVRVFDTVIDDDGKEKRVLNGKETTLAQQKQEAIGEAFSEWIWKDPHRREILAKKYNEIYNSIRPREFDGKHIKFDGMNPLIKLNAHQSNAVARTLYGGNTLLAHVVGAGKTFTMIASAMEGKRLGLQQKSLFVVPNHLTEQMGGDIHTLYPGANILVATKKDFEPANRKKFCSRIATGDFDIVVIGHSQFEKIPLSALRQEEILKSQIDEIMLAIKDAKEQNGERYTVKQLEKTKKSLETRLEKLSSQERKDSVVTFEELGVDKLYVDEAHLFKNLFLQTKMRNVAGIGQSEAQKSTDMFTKCRYMDELTGGKGVVFATGTPVSNSMTELYTMMRYLQYGTLQRLDLTHFDSWAANFGEKVTAIELAPEGTGFRAKTRFAKFFNLPELINIWKEAADIQTADMLNLPVPEALHTTVVTKPSEFQRNMVKDLADRANAVRKKEVEPNVDNMLRITSDGRKLALDQRLQNDMLSDDPSSKINTCVDNVFDIWKETTGIKGTQLIFCDLSTPHYDGTFNVYDDFKNKLMEKGIPSEEIKYIHDANTEQQKAELFAKVRSGDVRVLIGSTQKMGAGTNVQKKLVALHHTDCPWRPADLEQREGRIVRQGNENKEVKIFKYVTENTFDAYNWSLIENKQKFIGQIFTSKSPARSADDIDATALSYAEVKALATGDPRIKEKMDLDIAVAKLKLMRSNHQSQKYDMEDRLIKYYPQEIKKTQERIDGMSTDYKVVQAHPVAEDSFTMTIKGKLYTERKAAGEAILLACKAIQNPEDKIVLGEFRGFPMTLYIDNGSFKIAIKNNLTYIAELENNITGNIVRINNALEGMPKIMQNLKNRLESLIVEQAAAQAEVDTLFPKEQEYKEKQARLTQLNIELDNAEKEEEQAENGEVEQGKKPSVVKVLKELKDDGKTDCKVADIPQKTYTER